MLLDRCTSNCRRGMPASPVHTGLSDHIPPSRAEPENVWRDDRGRQLLARAVHPRGPSRGKQSRAEPGSAGTPRSRSPACPELGAAGQGIPRDPP